MVGHDVAPELPGRPSIPFLNWIGARIVSFKDGQSEVRLVLQPQHRNSWKVCHGGVLMTLLDVAMANAARSLHPEQRGCATVDLATSFVQPGTGDELIAVGRCYHRSSTMAFCEAEVRNGSGDLVARGSGTFKYLKRPVDPGNAAAQGTDG